MKYHALYRSKEEHEYVVPEWCAVLDDSHKNVHLNRKGLWDDYELVAVVGIDDDADLSSLIDRDDIHELIDGVQHEGITLVWHRRKFQNP